MLNSQAYPTVAWPGESQGPTTFLWVRRNGEWRLRFGEADHYI